MRTYIHDPEITTEYVINRLKNGDKLYYFDLNTKEVIPLNQRIPFWLNLDGTIENEIPKFGIPDVFFIDGDNDFKITEEGIYKTEQGCKVVIYYVKGDLYKGYYVNEKPIEYNSATANDDIISKWE